MTGLMLRRSPNRRRTDGPYAPCNALNRLVFAAFLAVTPIISSITWDHHLVTELLVLTLLAPSLRPGTAPTWLGTQGL